MMMMMRATLTLAAPNICLSAVNKKTRQFDWKWKRDKRRGVTWAVFRYLMDLLGIICLDLQHQKLDTSLYYHLHLASFVANEPLCALRTRVARTAPFIISPLSPSAYSEVWGREQQNWLEVDKKILIDLPIDKLRWTQLKKYVFVWHKGVLN